MVSNSELGRDISILRRNYLRKFHTPKDTFFVASIFAGLFLSEKYRARSSDLEAHTHFTPNTWNWKSKTHGLHGLQIIKYLDLDIDISPDPKTRTEYLQFFGRKCQELSIKPFSILSTPGGYRIAFQLRYPVFADNRQVFHLCEAALVALKEIFQSDRSPGLSSFTRMPQSHNSILLLESFNTIILSEILKRAVKLSVPVTVKPRAKAQAIQNVGFWALRNNTAYTLALICRSYGRDMAFTRNLVHSIGELDSERQLEDTLKSAYTDKHHATNKWCQDLCLGESVSDVARRFRIIQKCTPEETKEAQSSGGKKGRASVKNETIRKILAGVGELKEVGIEINATNIIKKTGISERTFYRYRHLIGKAPF